MFSNPRSTRVESGIIFGKLKESKNFVEIDFKKSKLRLKKLKFSSKNVQSWRFMLTDIHAVVQAI